MHSSPTPLSLLSSLPPSPPSSYKYLHHPLLPLPRHPLLPRPQSRRGTPSSPDPSDRLISSLSYFYPFLDGFHLGRFLLAQFPPLQPLLLVPFAPAIRLLNSSPLNPFLVFLTLYFAVVRNPSSFSRYVRFNTMQAIALDVLLIFPDLVERVLDPREGFGVDVVMGIDTTVFLFLIVSMIYGSISCVLGMVPRLPIVADAADSQVM